MDHLNCGPNVAPTGPGVVKQCLITNPESARSQTDRTCQNASVLREVVPQEETDRMMVSVTPQRIVSAVCVERNRWKHGDIIPKV